MLHDAQKVDPRVLQAQLSLAARSIQATRYSSPLWALVAAVLCSRITGSFGQVPVPRAMLLPLAVTLVVIVATVVSAAYERYGGSEGAVPWFRSFVVVQLAASAAWGLMPWLCWEPANPLNHMFLACGVMTVIATQMVSRGNNMTMYVASLAPLTLMASARFLTSDLSSDMILGGLAPLLILQLCYNSWPLMARMDEDLRLRFRVEDMAGALGMARDEALRKRFEAETANASKTAFLANMSHELRTPLNAILGFSEIIAQECFGPVGSDRYRDYAGDIHSSGAHLLSLINDLLDVAKIEAGRMDIAPHPLDTARMFDLSLRLVSIKAREKRQALTVAIAPDAPPLYADERALKQILINLVSNAVKFTPQGGRIAVWAGPSSEGAFMIVVRDNGPGIAPDKMDAIFTPFNQGDNRFDRQTGGTGLGLALVRGLAELHGGRAWMESEHGNGCSVFVVLPLWTPQQGGTAIVAA
jgi:two-component system cell cycle sensor histidine kinase PleC